MTKVSVYVDDSVWLNFQKRGGQPMQAELWVRERNIDGLTELILIRAHVKPL